MCDIIGTTTGTTGTLVLAASFVVRRFESLVGCLASDSDSNLSSSIDDSNTVSSHSFLLGTCVSYLSLQCLVLNKSKMHNQNSYF